MSRQGSRVKSRERDKDLTQSPARLRWRRKAALLTIKQLSERSGISTGAISYLENGVKSADLATLAALAEALECGARDLMPPEPGTEAVAV
jgi:transcriptional regulator with XRE-family HTH domain